MPKIMKIEFSKKAPGLHSGPPKSENQHDKHIFDHQMATKGCHADSHSPSHKANPFMAGFSFAPKSAQNARKRRLVAVLAAKSDRKHENTSFPGLHQDSIWNPQVLAVAFAVSVAEAEAMAIEEAFAFARAAAVAVATQLRFPMRHALAIARRADTWEQQRSQV